MAYNGWTKEKIPKAFHKNWGWICNGRYAKTFSHSNVKIFHLHTNLFGMGIPARTFKSYEFPAIKLNAFSLMRKYSSEARIPFRMWSFLKNTKNWILFGKNYLISFIAAQKKQRICRNNERNSIAPVSSTWNYIYAKQPKKAKIIVQYFQHRI